MTEATTNGVGEAVRFDLIDEPWVPVLAGGRVSERSLVDVLAQAHEIRGLAAGTPTMTPAILRQVLLPVVLDVFGAPRDEADWARRWQRRSYDAGLIRDYLDEHRDRFDLFHPMQPFGQVAGLRTPNDEHKPASQLMPAIASGNSVPLFSARTEADSPALSAAEAVRWLLHVQCWDTAGIKTGAVGDPQVKGGKTTGNQVGPLGRLGVVWPTGRTLFETLMLNTPLRAAGLAPDDKPSWRRPPVTATWQERLPAGILDLMTWQSRRVRLIPDTRAGQVRVTSVVLAAGDRMPSTPRYEPHTMWRLVERGSREKVSDPLRHRPGRQAWRGLDALLAVPSVHDTTTGVESSHLVGQVADLQEGRHLDTSYPLGIELTGVVYGNQSAVVEHVVADAIPLPIAALRADDATRALIESVASCSDELAKSVDTLDADLRIAAGGDPTPWDRGQRPGAFVIQQLDPVARRLLAGLQREPHRSDEADRAWVDAARRITTDVAEQLLSSVTPSAFAGRDRTDAKKKTRRVTVASAERNFWRRVGDLLPRPDPARGHESGREAEVISR